MAQTVTVTTVEDVVDFAGAQNVGDLPGPDGRVSFREALTATNRTAGPQTIEFAIPRSDWWLVGEYALLKLENGIFPVTDDFTTIDFSSQTDFTGDTNPAGTEVGIYGLQPNGWGHPAIVVLADDCVIHGLGHELQRGPSISIQGGVRNRITGCTTDSVELDPYPGTTSENVIGGTDPVDKNVLDAIDIFCGANDNVVIGNRVRSVNVIGSQYCEFEFPERNRIGGPTPAERNILAGAGSYSSEGFPTGANVEVTWARDTLVQGNYIGVDADGLTRVPQVGPTGIQVRDSFSTMIRDNVVAGMWVVGINHYAGQLFGQAIQVTATNADNHDTVIEGNLIGTDASGTSGLLTLNGILVAPQTTLRAPYGTRIGGLSDGQANVVAFTERRGIGVASTVGEVEISANSIHGNGLLGIDLSASFTVFDGVTDNDLGDLDVNGANDLQNYPVVETAATNGTAIQVTGRLNTRPATPYRIELFAGTDCHPSGHGEGQRYLGSIDVLSDGMGDAAFATTFPAAVAHGEAITATATDLTTNQTSEFSRCLNAKRAFRRPSFYLPR